MGMVKSDILLFFFLMLSTLSSSYLCFLSFLTLLCHSSHLIRHFFLSVVDLVTPFKEKSIDFESLKYLITIQSLVCLLNYNFI